MNQTASLFPLALAAALLAAPASAQAVAGHHPAKEQAAFVLHLDGLSAANAGKLEAALAKVPTVARVSVDAAHGSVALATGDGVQLDSDAAFAAVKESGLTLKSYDIPDWAAETVFVVQVSGGS